MKKTTLFFTVFAFFLVSSCIPSLHSIVSDENRIIDDRWIGDWILGEDDSIWKFERAAKLEFEYVKLPEGIISWSQNEIGGKESTLNKIRQLYGSDDIVIKEEKKLPYYILTHEEKGDPITKVSMKAELTQINDNFYMDIYPHDMLGTWRFAPNYINSHTFAKVTFNQGKIIINAFNGSYIESLIKQKRIRLKHEIVNEDITLTASTTELRAFISKYSRESDLFEESEVLTLLE